MQQRLALPASARKVATSAIIFYLCDVPFHRKPSFNLPIIFFWHATP
jgi:hypothetical protein